MSNPAHPGFVCRINAGNVIVAAGDCWSWLLQRSPAVDVPPFLGKLIWNHLSDTMVMHLYEALVAKVRRTGEDLTVPCRCDLPGRRLYLEMRVIPLPAGAVDFCAVKLREEPQPETAAMGQRRIAAEMLRVCGWCKRVGAPEWVEVEVAVRRLKLLELDEIRRVTHSICPECAEKVIRNAQG
jgi:hypothetical protein